jgi:6-phosphogluconolactonase
MTGPDMTGPTAPVADVPAAFTDAVLEAFAARPGPRFTLVLSGGPTAKLCYEHLAAATLGPRRGDIDWTLVDIYMGDERVVPPDDEDANQHLVRLALIDPIGAVDEVDGVAAGVGPVGSFTPMPTEGPVEQCVASYQLTVRRVLDGPGIDLIHLGLGPDGHTASLFKGAPTLNAGPDELVAATQDPNGVNAHPRLTLTLPVINAARTAVFTVAGPAKQEAVAAVRRGDDIPATRISPQRIIWLVDDAAFSQRP